MVENVSKELIEQYLEGRDPQKYIVGIEADYYDRNVHLIINDPEKGKYIEKHRYKPFLWMKKEGADLLYGGNREKVRAGLIKYGLKIVKLQTANKNGVTPVRLENGYKFKVEGTKSYGDLLNFFRDAGVDVFGQEKLFMTIGPGEQFLIQSGKRLFKGMDDYDDLHRFQFDLETTGLETENYAFHPETKDSYIIKDPKKPLKEGYEFKQGATIFQIGMKNNRGFEQVLEVRGNTKEELEDQELAAIITFFKIIDYFKPDIIAGYNSEFFDFNFLVKRCEMLGVDIKTIAKTLDGDKEFKRANGTVKFGSETEFYEKTVMWGHNIIDISHAVRRAQAIDSSIKGWGLKYITKFAGVAKENRVYVEGDKIHKTWNDLTIDYAFNDINGDYYEIDEQHPLKEDYTVVKGDYIVQRYLIDDLWETEQVDMIFNQASFLLSKLVPASYTRTSTMGGASLWRLLMCGWSYENDLAIPSYESKRDFTGGLSRLLEVGFAKNVYKLDYAALYPNTELTHDIFPDLDISGVMKNLLLYIADARDTYKNLKNETSAKSKAIFAELEENPDKYSEEERASMLKEAKELKKKASNYDKKQLPLKILANSFFGSFGAPYIFNWGDIDCAEETTCRGRQYLRLMVKFFTEKYGFRPLVMDTDGVNFSAPENIDEIKYVSPGKHRFTEKDKEYTGCEAVVAEFNDLFMEGRMGLDIDDFCTSTINFSRKNYANDIGGKIKLVGNTIKSKKLPTYIEEFLDKGVRMLLDGKGYEFLEYYYEYVDKIYKCEIPLSKIASKARVKITLADYKKKMNTTNKAGNPMPRQAHMELIVNHKLNPGMGDTIYYVNTGTAKSHGDMQTIDNKETGKKEIVLNCKLLSAEEIAKNPDLTTDEYNVPKYLNSFNKRIHPLLVCFSKDIREQILIDMVKDKKTKTLVLQDRTLYPTPNEAKLTFGTPFETKDQDTYEDLMIMEDKEIEFWLRVDKLPNNMTKEEWDATVDTYVERKIREKTEGIKKEKEDLDKLFKELEVYQLEEVESGVLPEELLLITTPTEEGFVSKKWEVVLCNLGDMFKYFDDAKKRKLFYDESGIDLTKKTKKAKPSKKNKTPYQMWLDHLVEESVFSGKTMTIDFSEPEEVEEEVIDEVETTEELITEKLEPEDEEDEWAF